MEYEIRNPRWARPDCVDLEWNHPDFGWIPFSCVDPSQPQWAGEPEYMAEIWAGLMRGDYGPIAEAR